MWYETPVICGENAQCTYFNFLAGLRSKTTEDSYPTQKLSIPSITSRELPTHSKYRSTSAHSAVKNNDDVVILRPKLCA